MSIINQMLRDLEKRRAHPPGGAGSAAEIGARPVPKERGSKSLQMVALVGALAAALWFARPQWMPLIEAATPLFGTAEVAPPAAPPAPEPAPAPPVNVAAAPPQPEPQAEPEPEPQPQSEATPEPAPAVEAPNPPAAAPATAEPRIRLTRLRVGDDRRRTRLVAELDADTPFTIERSVDGGRILVDLEGTAAADGLAPPQPLRTLLDAVELTATQRGMRLTLRLHRDTAYYRYFTLPARRGGDGIRLVVDLYRPNAEAAATTAEKRRPAAAEERPLSRACKHALATVRGDGEAAEGRLRACLRESPDAHPARSALAALMINSGRLSEAAPLLAEGVRRAPAEPTLARLYARLLVAGGRGGEALALLRGAGDEGAEHQAFLGALEQREGNHDEALAAYRKALAVEPGRGAWRLGAAISLEALGRPGEAFEAYRDAVRDPALDAQARDYARARLAALGQEAQR